MKSGFFLLLIALLPLATFAGNGGKNKNKKELHVNITIDKKGKVAINGLDGDLKDLQTDLNKALENVTLKIDDGKRKREIHINATIN
jgi:biopolymer transport protein ExbD